MRLVLINPTLVHGGTQRVMSELANTWSRNGHEVHIILFSAADRFYDLEEKIIVHDLDFKYNTLNKIVSQVLTIYKLRKLLLSIDPDTILSFVTQINISAILATRFTNMKLYISDRNSPYLRINKIHNLLRNILSKFFL